MIDRTNRNGLSSYSMAKQEFEEEFFQRSPRACAAENGWPAGVIYHFVSNSGLTLRTHKRELQYLHTVWGVGFCIFLLSLFFFLYFRWIFLFMLCFSDWSPCPSSSLCSPHPPLWLVTTDLSSYITYCWEGNSYVPAAWSSVSSRCWKSQACQYFMHLKSNKLSHIWLLQGALYVSLLSLSRCAKLLLLVYHQTD